MGKRKESDNNIYDLTTFKIIGKCTVKGGHTFKFDKKDYPIVSTHKWRYNGKYIVSCPLNHESIIKLHRFLLQDKLDLPENKDKSVCFRNHDPLDLQRRNLIIVTTAELRALSRSRSNTSSEVKGVSYNKRRRAWIAYISVDNKRKELGIFKYEEQAIIARLKAEYEFLGPYAPQKDLFPQYGITAKSTSDSIGTRLHDPRAFKERKQRKKREEAIQKAWAQEGFTDRDLTVQYYMNYTRNMGIENRIERDLIDTDLVNTYASRLYIPEAY